MLGRIRVFALSLSCLAGIGIGNVSAQDYPTRPVRWIVAFAAGGPTDILARIMGQYLSERLGQQFIVDNRPGAGGNIGTQAAINSAPDGYTILMAAHVHAINATLYQKLPYNFLTDIAPIAGLVRVPNVMEVTASFPAKTVSEFIAYAKVNPGKISYASAGNGTSAHLAAELFKAMTGVELLHVPYRGSGPALTDLISGQVHVMFDTIPSSIEHIKAGKLRALGVTSVTRSDVLPDVPPIADTVPGYELGAWFGVGAPKDTPAAIIEKLNREINAGLADPKIKHALPSSAPSRCRRRSPSSENSSSMKPRNGPKWSSSPAPRLTEGRAGKCQDYAAGRMISTRTARPARVASLIRASRLNFVMRPRSKSLSRGCVTPSRLAAAA